MNVTNKSILLLFGATILALALTTDVFAFFDRQPSAPYKKPIEALTVHNQLRAKHGAPKLVWDDTLASYAKNHAETCRFKHSRSPYGENLAAGFPSMTAAVNGWYSEHKQYSYWRPGFSYGTGHFTQLVWKSTQKLGCGYAVCNGKNGTPGRYYVCEYSPRGNIVSKNKFQLNVLPS